MEELCYVLEQEAARLDQGGNYSHVGNDTPALYLNGFQVKLSE